jgi:uncharacterized membrane protein YeaQ/YmgE (transglycosylase-associated protein family)
MGTELLAFAPVAGHHIIGWLVIGLIAGMLAGLLVRGNGFGLFGDIGVGLVGAVIGGLILHALRGGTHTSTSFTAELVVAFIGAVILLLLARLSHHNRRSYRRGYRRGGIHI